MAPKRAAVKKPATKQSPKETKIEKSVDVPVEEDATAGEEAPSTLRRSTRSKGEQQPTTERKALPKKRPVKKTASNEAPIVEENGENIQEDPLADEPPVKKVAARNRRGMKAESPVENEELAAEVPAKKKKQPGKKTAAKEAPEAEGSNVENFEESESSPPSEPTKVEAEAKKRPGKKAASSKQTLVTAENEVPSEEGDDPQAASSNGSAEDPDLWKNASSIHEFTVKDINGEDVALNKYRGHVCVIVNVASRCGHTKSNYEQFVELHDKYADSKGLRILAFPCNQFGGQEPGDAAKICEFAKKRNVKFDLFDKINVNGKNAHPLWKFLKEKLPGTKTKEIKWNFAKFIVDKDGVPVERFESAVKPLTLVEHLEKLW